MEARPRPRAFVPVSSVLMIATLCPAATLDVKDHGAKGDGTTDDTVAIRNAANNAAKSAAGPNTVFFAAGTYLVGWLPIGAKDTEGPRSAELLGKAPQDLVLEGESRHSSILKRLPVQPDSRIATIFEGTHLTVRGLGFDADRFDFRLREGSPALGLGAAIASTGYCLEWTPLSEFSGPGSIGSPGGTHPIAAAGDTVHVVWAQGSNLYYRRSIDRGRTWGHAVRITDHATAQYPCSLEQSGAALHLIWPDSRSGRSEVYYKRSKDDGDTWGPERRLTPGVDLFRMGTAISGSTLHVVWGSKRLVIPTTEGTHTWGEIYAIRSTDGGKTWGAPMRLTQPEASAMRPSVADSGKSVTVTWFDRRDSATVWDWEVYTKRSTDGGVSWGDDVRMSRTPTHTRHPEIVATPGGIICCVWEDGQVFDGKQWGGDPALYASSSKDDGATWGEPRRITAVNAPNGWATHAKLHASGTTLHLAWTDAPDGQDRPRAAFYMTSPDGGLTWGAPERLTSAADGECWIEAVGGTESYAVVLVRRGDRLCSSRCDLGIVAPEGRKTGS